MPQSLWDILQSLWGSIHTQNWFNLIGLLAIVAINVGGTMVNHQYSHSKTRNNDAVKLSLEILSRIYLGYATFYMSIVLLVTRAKPLESINGINFLMGVIMLLLYVATSRWVHNFTTDERIMRHVKRRLCKTVEVPNYEGVKKPIRECYYYKCLPDNCRRDLTPLECVRMCKSSFIFAFLMLIVNIIVSLTPVTRP